MLKRIMTNRVARFFLLALTALVFKPVLAAEEADRIIVSGASGQLGGLVVEELLARGVSPSNLILVSRTPEELSNYADMGASTRFGDFDDPESLPSAYEGGDRMLLISIGGPNRPARHKLAIDAAVAAGVRQIAYTSFVNMENNDMPLASDHRQTEDILKASGVAFTFLRNSIYMDNIVGQASQIAGQSSITVPESVDRIAYVTREDCAAAAAAVLTTPGHDNKAYNITGPVAIGMPEIARAVSELTGRNITVNTDNNAPPSRGMGGGTALLLATNEVETLTGRPATSVKDFLAANRDRWDD